MVRRTPFIMISFRLASLCDLFDMICFGLTPLMRLYQWKSFWLTCTPLLRTVWCTNSTTLKCTFCANNIPQLFQVLLFNDLAPLCNTSSSFLFWKLRVVTIPSLVSPIFQWLYTTIFLLIHYSWELKSDEYRTSMRNLFLLFSLIQ